MALLHLRFYILTFIFNQMYDELHLNFHILSFRLMIANKDVDHGR